MRHNAYKAVLLSILVLLCLGVAACGNVRRDTSSKPDAASVAPIQNAITGDYDNDDYNNVPHTGDADNDDSKPTDRDNDSDNSTGSYYDSDDSGVRDFGHAADASDKQVITTLVERYYHVAAAEDGAAGCSMIMKSLERSLPEDLGRSPGPTYLRGKTCSAVMSKVFKQDHQQLAAYAAGLEITGVRIDGNRGIAVLGFKALPGRQMRLAREGHAWKLEGLLDSELP